MEDKKDIRELLSRIASTPGATLEDIGTEAFGLENTEDRQGIIRAVREEILRILSLSISGGFKECLKSPEFKEELFADTETEKAIEYLKNSYENLPEKDRSLGGEILSWEQVFKAIPDIQDFLAGVGTLNTPTVYFVNKEGQLIIGDGCSEPPAETLGKGYFELRKAAARISYIDEDDGVVTIENKNKVPCGAKIISEKGLITEEEERRINKGNFEKEFTVWLERGDNPASVHCAHYRGNDLSTEINIPQSKRTYVGARCVFRVNLDFEKDMIGLDKNS